MERPKNEELIEESKLNKEEPQILEKPIIEKPKLNDENITENLKEELKLNKEGSDKNEKPIIEEPKLIVEK